MWRPLALVAVVLLSSGRASADEDLLPPPPPVLDDTDDVGEDLPKDDVTDDDVTGDDVTDEDRNDSYDEVAEEYGILPWDPGVPLFSAAGCIAGAALGPVLPLGLAIPAAYYVVENPGVVPLFSSTDPACASFLTVFACAGVGLASLAPCSALGATLGAMTAASSGERSLWRPLLGGVPGILCAVLSPLSCLCFPLPGGSLVTGIGLAVGILGGPLSVAGASVVDAQVAERTVALVDTVIRQLSRRDDDDDDASDSDDDVMHY